MKTYVDYGVMLAFLACLFACCACKEEAKEQDVLLRGGASTTIEVSILLLGTFIFFDIYVQEIDLSFVFCLIVQLK